MKSNATKEIAKFSFCDSTWDKVEEKAKAMKITSKKLAEKIVENFFIERFNQPKILCKGSTNPSTHRVRLMN